MKALAVTGYASVDYAVCLDGRIRGDHTTLINRRDRSDWPRIGGCPAFVSIEAARNGCAVHPVSWIGNDGHARLYLDGLARSGVGREGIAQVEYPSPISILAYEDDGACACLFDPGFAGKENLTPEQGTIISRASHVCISVGPPHLMEPILDKMADGARLYWIGKNDAHSFSPAIRSALSARADVIFCSQAEAELIDRPPEETTIVETLGSKGVRISRDGKAETIVVEPIVVRDTTGAGDTFAGAFIAAEMSGASDPVEAANAGITGVRVLLEKRLAAEEL